MENNIKRFLSLVVALVMVFGMLPMGVFAAEGDTDFTDAVANEAGTGWDWDNDSKTLTLSGAAITTAVTLPDGATIVVTEGTENTIAVSGSVPVTTAGALAINGTGALAVTAVAAEGEIPADAIVGESITVTSTVLTVYGRHGLDARNVSINDAKVDIKGYTYGIYNEQLNGSSSVVLNNVSGSIIGLDRCGIFLYVEANGDNDAENMDSTHVDIVNCKDLTINGELTRNGSTVYSSGILVYCLDPETNAYVHVENSDISVNGGSSGIYVTCHSDNSASDDDAAAWITITDSKVDLKAVTKYWAALFVNNHGTGEKATSSITLNNSLVKALCPNDVGLMTSTKNAASVVSVINSSLDMSGAYTGIRAKSNDSDAADIIIEGSVVVVTDGIAKNYVGAMDEMDNAKSHDATADSYDSNSVVIVPVDCEITDNGDGTWEIPVGGTVTRNEVIRTCIYGATILEDGTIVEHFPKEYVAYNKNDNEFFTDLSDALDVADSGEKVQLLKTWYEELVLVPAGVTFDLNGNVVETKNTLSFGVVMDGQENVGGIKIPFKTTEAFTKLQPVNGGYLPIYDAVAGMYKFFAYEVESSQYGMAKNDPTQVYFAARILFKNPAAYKVLMESDNTGMDFVMNMSWTGVTNFGVRYTITANTLKAYAAYAYDAMINNAENTKAISLTVKGIDKLGDSAFISAAPSVQTVAEVTASSATMTYNIP